MRILSRYAESLFWFARYLERAASLARVIEMQSSFGDHEQNASWSWLLTLHGDEERFAEHFELSTSNIITFYVLDKNNPGSLRSSLNSARENARSLRPFIPLDMWEQLNSFYDVVQKLDKSDIEPSQLPRTCAILRSHCLSQIGIAVCSLFRDEGYTFFNLGMLIERADQTSRLLDVKYARVVTGTPPKSASDEFLFGATILRTASAYQTFRRLDTSSASPDRVARFLILNPSHPRSIGFCVREIERGLQELRSNFRLQAASAALEACDDLMHGMQAAAHDTELDGRLHDFNEWVQRSLFGVTNLIAGAFFRSADQSTGNSQEPLVADEELKPTTSTSSQSQTQ